MGIYVNPPDATTKEAKVKYIAERSEKIALNGFRAWPPGADGKFGVCIVDNGPFNAAGVAWDSREADAFTLPNDHRPRQFFLMPLEAMKGCLLERHEKELTEIAAKAIHENIAAGLVERTA